MWNPPTFSSNGSNFSYHVYIDNENGQFLFNDTVKQTSLQLPDVSICAIVTATVAATSGQYTSSNVNTTTQYTGGIYN